MFKQYSKQCNMVMIQVGL